MSFKFQAFQKVNLGYEKNFHRRLFKYYRTKPCKFFQSGCCRYGKRCRFIHDSNALALTGLLNHLHVATIFLGTQLDDFREILFNQNETIKEQAEELSNLKRCLVVSGTRDTTSAQSHTEQSTQHEISLSDKSTITDFPMYQPKVYESFANPILTLTGKEFEDVEEVKRKNNDDVNEAQNPKTQESLNGIVSKQPDSEEVNTSAKTEMIEINSPVKTNEETKTYEPFAKTEKPEKTRFEGGLCTFFLQGNCSWGSCCRFSHENLVEGDVLEFYDSCFDGILPARFISFSGESGFPRLDLEINAQLITKSASFVTGYPKWFRKKK